MKQAHKSILVMTVSISLGTSIVAVDAKLKVVDTIDAVVFGNQIDIVTKSEVDRISLDGALRTLDEVIFERMLLDAAAQYKIMPDERAVNSYLEMVQKENNLTLDDIKQMFMSSGRTFEEGRQELSRTFVANNLLDWKVRSRAVVTEKEVVAYYNAHPVYYEASWTFRRGFVSCLPEKEQIVNKQITNAIAAGTAIKDVEWGSEFSIEAGDIADDKKFILDLKIDQISSTIKIPGGFEFFKLIEKRDRSLVPMDVRYRDIVRELAQPKHEQLYEEYRTQLYDSISVMYLNR